MAAIKHSSQSQFIILFSEIATMSPMSDLSLSQTFCCSDVVGVAILFK